MLKGESKNKIATKPALRISFAPPQSYHPIAAFFTPKGTLMPPPPPDQPSDRVAYRAFPVLEDALRRRIAVILQQWEQSTRQLLPHARPLSHTAFRDDVPLTLQRLADALAAQRPVGLYQLEDIARVHGTSRFD